MRKHSETAYTSSKEIASSKYLSRNTYMNNLRCKMHGSRTHDEGQRTKRLTRFGDKSARKSFQKNVTHSTGTDLMEKSSAIAKTIQVVAKKLRSYRVKTKDDKYGCWFTGIAITTDGKILIVDRGNSTVKAFSRKMKLQSKLELPEHIWDITIFNDTEAVLGTYSNKCIFIDISGESLKVTRTLQLPFTVYAACNLNDKPIAVTRDTAMGVTMFELSGKVYWSVSGDFEGQSLYPVYILRHGDTSSTSFLVTDQKLNAILCIRGEDGEITRNVQLKGKTAHGITSDKEGNIYVCMIGSDEIIALNADMSEQKVLLTKKDKLRESPQTIAYDDDSRCLIVSYMSCEVLDIFQVS